jgi:putative thioredoxin
MTDVTVANFESEVVEASLHTPVLVDFWAPWCGPCKSLGPVLDKLEADYGGRFKLVKINSDDEQELAGAFGIRSIPTCVLMVGGKPVDGFMGAQTEGQVKAFLDKHVPAANELEAASEEEAALDALADGDVEAALAKLQHAVDTDPENDDARFDLVKLLLQQGFEDEAKVVFAPVIAKSAGVRKLDSLNHWIKAIDSVAAYADIESAEAELTFKDCSRKARF